MAGGTFCEVGGKVHVKTTIQNFCGLIWLLWRHRLWNIMPLPVHHMKV